MEAAWMGKIFPLEPGQATWKFKTLAGITATNLSSSERSAVLGRNGNLMTEIGGVDITEEGTMASGEFIDVIRGVDWIHARIQERVFTLLVNTSKVPYTNAGITMVENEVRAVLSEATLNGILSEDEPYTVTVPNVLDIAQPDKATRCLPDVKFSGVLAGAIHKVKIQGVVTV